MQQLQHNRNEKQEVEFFQDKQYTISFDFYNKNAEDLYIDGLNGDITPLIAMEDKIRRTAKVYTPYIPQNQKPLYYVKTLNDITPNLSKYIPEDNAVLFLSVEDHGKYRACLKDSDAKDIAGIYPNPFVLCDATTGEPVNTYNKLTIFLPHGTQAKLQKAEEVSKYLWENFKIKPNLFALHWFYKDFCFDNEFHIQQINTQIREYEQNIRLGLVRQGFTTKDLECSIQHLKVQLEYFKNRPFNKIITTNSTGVVKPEDSNERLQVIDCFDIFQDHLNNI